MDNNEIIRVLVADDQDLIRNGFKAIFNTYDGIEVVGVATDGIDAVKQAQALKPDVILMDVRMPELDGIRATQAITENPLLNDSKVIVLTTFDLDEYVFEAMQAGASGFLLKDSDTDDIAEAIRIVNRGDAMIQPSMMSRFIKKYVRPGVIDDNAPSKDASHFRELLNSLTEREQEILKLVANGLSNQEIAEILYISPATVKTHLARVMAKVKAHDRAQLVIFAYESGLVSAG